MSEVIWPRHADGSCDYDGRIEPPSIRPSENNKAGNATAAESENPNEETANASAIEHAESAAKYVEEATLPESGESERLNTEVAAAKKALPIVPIAAGGVVLLAARNKERRQELGR